MLSKSRFAARVSGAGITKKRKIMLQSKQENGQPRVVKYQEPTPRGVRSVNLSRYAIGYVIHGTKHIYSGDKRKTLARGDMFFMGIGLHYTEEIPEVDHPFEQIIFYYTPDELQRILLHLNITYNLSITNNHSCAACRTASSVTMPSTAAIRGIFLSATSLVREEESPNDSAVESFKLTELIYHIAVAEDCCLKSKVLRSIDTAKEGFEQIVYNHIFTECSIEELARKTHRSLTSFKKEFRRIYDMPPHKWFIRQRLIHSRLLLISTNKSVSEVGISCSFPNTSHFIKLFKKAYGHTPASYRTLERTAI